MSLKHIHVVFIAAATALSVVFERGATRNGRRTAGRRCSRQPRRSAATAIGLLVYGRWFLVKMRGLGE